MPENTDTQGVQVRSRLIKARRNKRWSQQDLAKLLGVKPLTVSRWERGYSTPSALRRRKLCELFDLSEAALDLGDGSREDGVVWYSSPHPIEYVSKRDAARRIDLLLDLGWLGSRKAGDLEPRTLLQDGLKLARAIGDRDRLANLLLASGLVSFAKRDYDQAMQFFQEGLTWTRGEMDNRNTCCLLLFNSGKAAIAQGSYTQADLLLCEGKTLIAHIATKNEWLPFTGVLLAHVCFVARMLGDTHKEEGFLKELLHLINTLTSPELDTFEDVLHGEMEALQLNAQDRLAAESFVQDLRHALSPH